MGEQNFQHEKYNKSKINDNLLNLLLQVNQTWIEEKKKLEQMMAITLKSQQAIHCC